MNNLWQLDQQNREHLNQILILACTIELLMVLTMQPSANQNNQLYTNTSAIQAVAIVFTGLRLSRNHLSLAVVLQALAATTAITLAPTWWAFALEGHELGNLPWLNPIMFFYGVGIYALVKTFSSIACCLVLAVMALCCFVPTAWHWLSPLGGWVWPVLFIGITAWLFKFGRAT